MMRRATILFAFVCLGLAAAGPAAAQTRVYRTPAPEPGPACSAAIDCRADLAGAPEGAETRAQPRKVWAVRSSHAPADAWPASFAAPIVVVADVDARNAVRSRDSRWRDPRWRRGRPDRRGRHGPRW